MPPTKVAQTIIIQQLLIIYLCLLSLLIYLITYIAEYKWMLTAVLLYKVDEICETQAYRVNEEEAETLFSYGQFTEETGLFLRRRLFIIDGY